ncbi:MAG: glycerol-3-phosphate 1-O-acyltransferase PlsY [Gammaproteobacteria bacterium]|nr:glycerol-3-phosphate 1-O-acyltransferase PlsY [Gammaproteobacteria bacterium]
MPLMTDTLLILMAYLFGSLSAAIIVCRLMRLPDPRGEGSGNPGATNVLRFGGKKAAAITLLGDLLKGVIPVLIAKTFTDDPTILASVAMAAFLGHLYPVFFGFKGGKGVATAAGVIIALSWKVGLAAMITWMIMAKLFKISSLSALTAAVLVPFYFWWLEPHTAYVIMTPIMSIILLWRHRSNIRHLIEGTEGKIGTDKK